MSGIDSNFPAGLEFRPDDSSSLTGEISVAELTGSSSLLNNVSVTSSSPQDVGVPFEKMQHDMGFQLEAVLDSLLYRVDNTNESISKASSAGSHQSLVSLNTDGNVPAQENIDDDGNNSESKTSSNNTIISGKSPQKHCIHYGIPGKKCFYGSKCPFRHDPTLAPSERPCPYYGIRGKQCFNGDKCQFLHKVSDVSTAAAPSGNGSSISGAGYGDEKNDNYESIEDFNSESSASYREFVQTAARPGQKKICFMFNSKKGCIKGEKCLYLHTSKDMPVTVSKKGNGDIGVVATLPPAVTGNLSPSRKEFRYCNHVSPVGTSCKLECVSEGSSLCRTHAEQRAKREAAYVASLNQDAQSAMTSTAGAGGGAGIDAAAAGTKSKVSKLCCFTTSTGARCHLTRVDGGNGLCRMHTFQQAGRVAAAEKTAAEKSTSKTPGKAVEKTSGKAVEKTSGKAVEKTAVVGKVANVLSTPVAATTTTATIGNGGNRTGSSVAKLAAGSPNGKQSSPIVSPGSLAGPTAKVEIAANLKAEVGQKLLSMLISEPEPGPRLAFGKLLKLLNENTPWVLQTIEQAAGNPNINCDQLIHALLTMVNVMAIV